MFSIIQIVMIIFALFALTRVILRLKDKLVSPLEFIFWSIVWLAVIVVGLFPAILGGVAESIGISSGISLIVYLSIIALFYLMFRLYVKIDSQEQQTTKLIRMMALSEKKKKK